MIRTIPAQTLAAATLLALPMGVAQNQGEPDRAEGGGADRTRDGDRSPRGGFDDRDVAAAVQTQLAAQRGLKDGRIDVGVSEGIATLEGTVPSVLDHRRALEATRHVRGVRGIVDRIEVRPVVQSDAQLRSSARGALASERAVDSEAVELSVEDGYVTLGGTADSWVAREVAEAAVLDVRGVKGVENEMLVRLDAPRSDGEIVEDVRARLEMDAVLADDPLRVEVDGSVVRLAGRVGSLAERERAGAVARVAGVVGVDLDAVEVVDDAAATDRVRPDRTGATDARVRDAALAVLREDPRVQREGAEVRVRAGRVTLTGHVSTLRGKLAAGESARSILGVRSVNNQLRVRPEVEQADGEINSAVTSALKADPVVDRHDLHVWTEDGEVSVLGQVDSRYEYDRITRVVSGVPGVVALHNHAGVREDATRVDDLQVHDAVREQLWWSPFVDSEQVEVRVEDGVARLTGTVDSWSERQHATTNAIEGGARTVINDLAVRGAGTTPGRTEARR